jgi:predicted nucleic acid-binding protein
VVDVLETAEEVYVPVIALGEIRSGFLRGRRAANNETRLQWFLSQNGVTTLGVDASVSHRYAEVHRALRKLGQPIPTNDLWVAALAIEHGLSLYTRDAHFAHVPGLARL